MMKAIIALPLLGFVVQATSLEDRYLKSEGERRDNNETLELILKNSRTVELSASEERGNQTFHMALPCSYLQNSNEDAKKPQTVIQEATSSLLAAKALVKTMLSKHDEDGDERTLDATAWEFLDALLLLPATDDLFFQSLGLLPKYWYASPAESSDFQSNAYIPNTRFPSWSLFGGKIPETEVDNHIHLLQSSHRLTTVPLYASIVWDMLLCAIPPEDTKNYTIAILEQKSSRGKDADIETKSSNGNHYTYHYDSNKDFWDKLDAYFNRIYEHHFYIHTVVMRGCFDGREMLVNSNSSIPCYNILHPWESLMDPTSPSWEIALQGTIKSMKKTNWKVPFRIPDLVRQSYDFPQNSQVYDAMIYLLEAQSKAEIPSQCQNSTSPSCAEAILLQNSPFAMLDVGYAAVLSQADADLYRLGRVLQLILPESYYSRSRRKEFQQQLQMLLQWQDDNARLFQDVLWHGAHKTYLSKCYNATTSEMEWIEDAVSNNLLAFWNVAAIEEESDLAQYNANDEDIIETTREQLKDLSMQLLRRDDKGELYSFDCGRFPLWSEGGCETGAEAISEQAGTRKWPVIQPVVNYLVASGLWRNSDLETFGRYMSEASLDLFCYQAAGIFGESFAVSAPYQNLANCDVCGNTSTATAAIVFNFLVPDAARAHRIPLPPIQRRWVITLITVELFVAFSIGVSCLILSFNLVRLNSTIIGGEPGEPSDAYDFNDDTGTQTYYDATSMTMPEDNSGQGGEEQPFLQANGKLS